MNLVFERNTTRLSPEEKSQHLVGNTPETERPGRRLYYSRRGFLVARSTSDLQSLKGSSDVFNLGNRNLIFPLLSSKIEIRPADGSGVLRDDHRRCKFETSGEEAV